MSRVSALLLLSFCLLPIAHAGDAPGKDWPVKEPHYPQQPHHPQKPHQPHHPQKPEQGFCDGRYEGFFYGVNGATTVEIEETGDNGELSVTAWWGGGMWRGQGRCCQQGPWSASIEMYFPGSGLHRGIINSNGNHAVMEGRIDFGPFFRMNRVD